VTARERLPELLHRPFRCWVGGHIVMEDSAGAHFHDHEYVQYAECGSDHDEKVTGKHHLGMVADESQPTLFWIGRAHWATGAQDTFLPCVVILQSRVSA
jgi:hypothetical protein